MLNQCQSSGLDQFLCSKGFLVLFWKDFGL